MKRMAMSAVFVALLGAQAADARPKIGLALSGGGAKGCAHVGVLRQLERMHIPVDYIAGTSMGAVVGALYASGMTADEIEKELTTIDWEEALSDATAFEHLTYRRKFESIRYPSTVEVGLREGKIVSPAGIRTGQKLSFLLARYLLPHLDQRDFNSLPIPYAAVATDLETGDPVVLRSGDLAEAVRASMSIPGAFTPVPWEGRILVDGGVVMNVPVDVAREMGADIVIAIDIAAPLAGREKLDSTLGVVGQLSGFLTRKNMTPQLAKADLVLSPDITGYDTFSFSKAAGIVKRGDEEAIRKKDQLAPYAIDPAEHEALMRSRLVARNRAVRIDEIRVEGLRFVDERFIRGQMETSVGETLDLDKLQTDVEWLYGFGDYIGIHAGLERQDQKNVLVMRVQEKPWGPAYIRTGIGVETRYNKPGVFLLLNYTKRWLNNRGAEWRNDLEFGTDWGVLTEFYQPRGYDKVGFIALGAGYRSQSLRLFGVDNAASQYEVRRFGITADVGVQLHTAGEARLGLFHRWNQSDVEIGIPGLAAVSEAEGGIRALLNINTTNEPFFPNRGTRAVLSVLAPLAGLGVEEPYIAVDLDADTIYSFGRHVFTVRGYLHDVYDAQAPILDGAVLGGLGKMGGYAYGSLLGQAGAIASAGYRNRITRIPGLSDGIYAGVLAEWGDVAPSLSDIDDLKSSGTFYIGLNTSYGPLTLAVAKSEDQDAQYYLQIGRSF